MRLAALTVTLCLTACTSRSGGTPHPYLSVFAAASLGATLESLKGPFESAHPGIGVRAELSASQLACAKVSEQNREADLVMSADYDLIDRLLVPEHAAFNLLFAKNALVIAYREDTPVGRALSAGEPWQRVLARSDVRVGIANPALAPVGYRALAALALNDRLATPELRLGAAIRAKLLPEHERPDVTKLIAPLETGEIDAAFVYRSEALTAKFGHLALDSRIDFSDPAYAASYALAEVEIAGATGRRTVRGSAAVYGLTVPKQARRPDLAWAFLRFMLSERGRAIAAKHHLPLLPPAEIQVHGVAPTELVEITQR